MDDKRIASDQVEQRDAATVAAIVSAGASVVSAAAAVSERELLVGQRLEGEPVQRRDRRRRIGRAVELASAR